MKLEKILVVDDVDEIRDILSAFLKEEGYEVYTAENGKKALNIVKEKNIDLVLTDVRMPEINGYDLTKIVKEINPGIGVIIMTAYTSVYTEGDMRKIGADDFTTKPFNLSDVADKIERVLFQMKNLKPFSKK